MKFIENEGAPLHYIVAEPNGYNPGASYPMVVLLHGFGSHMGDLVRLAPLIDAEHYVYACPNAPIAMDLGGFAGYAWAPLDGNGARQAQAHAEDLLRTFCHEVFASYNPPGGQAVIAGFSQGGMMAYRTGLTEPEAFRGVAALSSRIPDPHDLRGRLPEKRDQAVFVAHGTMDTLLPIEDGRRSLEFLTTEGYKATYREYPMGHEITPSVLDDLTAWLHEVLPPPGGRKRRPAPRGR
jgi:phospholipase/carboxylesterase